MAVELSLHDYMLRTHKLWQNGAPSTENALGLPGSFVTFPS